MPRDDDKQEFQVGYIRDYISGKPIRATPEELQAVQVFARRLVEDFDYPKSHIVTHPQFRVRSRPSDDEKSFPVDIAVFSESSLLDEELLLVVECKQKDKTQGIQQLKLYLDMSAATLGVWFNGDDHQYVRKVYHPNGTRTYQNLPNIPKFGQRIEDIGLFKRKDLRRPSNLKAVFRDIRSHLAGMTTGITRDESLAQEIINILFCKILDEQETDLEETVTFRAGVGESPEEVQDRILTLFERVKSATFEDVVSGGDAITLDPESLVYVVGELQNYCIMSADRDAIGDAFEVFIGPALRGAEGQFFTPRNVVQLIVGIIDPKPGDRIIDPACGSGGFLIASLEHVWAHLRADAKKKGWTSRQLSKREIEVATDSFRGADKDAFLAKVCKAYMALVGDGRGGIFCTNSLSKREDWPSLMQSKVKFDGFSVVLTNPPFGKKIVVKGQQLLVQYDFGHKWKYDRKAKRWSRTSNLHDEQPPQILFLERCLKLLKAGGTLGIVLPESILGNPSYGHVVQYIVENLTITAIITMPESLFKTSGKGGTHTKVCVLILKKEASLPDHAIFMAEAKWCGHDSRGNPTFRKSATGELELLDDTPTITALYHRFSHGLLSEESHLGFTLRKNEIKNSILVPKYYNPEIDRDLESLKASHGLVTVHDLIANGSITLSTGVEVGKMAYGTGPIPFIRTSDISNWEIKADFKHGVSPEIYEAERAGADVEAGDILLVRDGTYLIGTTAIVTESDLPMLFQSHVIRIRVSAQTTLDSWLLFACLNAPIVKRQMKAKQFTQDIIDTLGKRVGELILPIPKDAAVRESISRETREVILKRVELRNRAKQIALEVQGIQSPRDEDEEALLEI
ncbi:MAG TPA: N-6 DNA methylase [Acidobacteriaceae bacterium]